LLEALNVKLDELKRFIAEKGKGGVVVAFSGGVDSATLAAVSRDVLGERVVAVVAKSPTYPSEELLDADRVAGEIGIRLYVVETNELENEDFSRNPENRCYYCKKALLERLVEFAHECGFDAVFEGTNYSDLKGHRPGFKAVQEVKSVFSPWMACGFTKEEIRRVAGQLGLSVSDKPALACLASRIPFNERITAEKLSRIEKAEQAVKAIAGVKQVRVRDHNGLARIEVGAAERALFCNVAVQDRVAVELKRLGFVFVAFDLEGYRSGSMLKTL